jgi:hypothetical protein
MNRTTPQHNPAHFALRHRARRRSNSSSVQALGVFSLIPLEICTIIWKYLLIDRKHIKISYTTTLSPIPDSEGKPQLQKFKARLPTVSILRLSKAIHTEIEEILFATTCLNSTIVPALPVTCLFSCKLLACERIGRCSSLYST